MSLWRQLTHGLRVLTNRPRADRDSADEAQHYLDEAVAERMVRGMTPAEAHRDVRLAMGSAMRITEEVRSHGWEHLVDTIFGDLRYAARRLRQSPGFSILAVVTLAVGIGASTAIFSVVNPALFRSLPYPEPDRIVAVADYGGDGSAAPVTFGSYREILARNHSFDAMAVIRPWQATLATDDDAERLTGERVSADYFKVLKVTPQLGRGFEDADDQVGGPPVVILGDAIWRRRFGGDPAIVGRQVRIEDNAFTVIGVMPATFENAIAPAAQLWIPLQYNKALPLDGREWGHHLVMVARLRGGVSVDDARRDLAAIGRTRLVEYPRVPWAQFATGMMVTSLQDNITRDVRPALLALLGAVGLVLLIACVNVTNLLLGRGAQRRGEFAVRAALGAARPRLVRQLLIESILLALIGGAVGMGLAVVGVQALVALSPPEIARLGTIKIGGAVLAFAIGTTTLIGILVGIAPALQISADNLHATLQQSSRRTAGRQRLTRGALVIAEVALALVLLVGAGLLMRTIEQLFAVSVGFDSSRLLTMQVVESGQRFTSDTTAADVARSNAARFQFYREAIAEVRRIPGVQSAAYTSQLPLSGDLAGYGVHFEVDQDNGNDTNGMLYAVDPAYFGTMRIPLVRGRLLDARDDGGAPSVALISASFARRKFPGQDAIGQRFKAGPDDGRWYSVVGIVGDVTQASLEAGEASAVYVTPTQWHWVEGAMSFVIRTRGDPATFATAARAAIWSVDKRQPIVRVATMSALVNRSEAQRRFALILFESFALAALVLAATGIYGVLSGSVAERMREIGVRAALGASRTSIVTLIVRQGMLLTLFGSLFGVIAAAVASKALGSLLFGVSHLDPVTYIGVIVLLVVVAALACWLPAWRAARIDPVVTLRAE